MNALMAKQIRNDYREILQSEAGRRVLGGIFFAGGLNGFVSIMNDFQRGRHDLALQIANTVREVDIYGVADCEKAYADFKKGFEDDGRTDNYDTGEYAE